jgi:phosphoglucomutase
MPPAVPDQSVIASALRDAESNLSREALSNLRLWLTDGAYSDFQAAIIDLTVRGAWAELEDAFYTTIPFGTGGRRGPRGPGPNRINGRTIAESARGLADWVTAHDKSEASRGIVIACDTRHGSPEFSQVCAQVIAAAGVPVQLFDSFRSTPELSFAVRHLRARAGIVISASHNPPADNGFKAYGEDGGQLVPPDDAIVMDHVKEASEGAIPMVDFEQAKSEGLVRIIGAEVDEAYTEALSESALTGSRGVRIVFTPLHGVGTTNVLPALARVGFNDVHIVEEQAAPDGDFSNVANHIPNPEVPAALAQARALAERIDADIAIASDPDADRLGCAAKRSMNGTSEWAPLNGNQIGAILCYFVLSELSEQGRMPHDPLVMRTAVTTGLIDRIAQHFGAGLISELLVGFKYIACVLKHLDDPNRFVFGTEESHGYLSRPYAHDKDGANAAVLLAEAAARMKENGHDLWWLLGQIYREFGYFGERMENYVRPGRAGQEEIVAMLDRMREQPPRSVAGLQVLRVVDRLHDQVRDMTDNRVRPFDPIVDPKTGRVIEQLGLAKDNLLIFHLAGNGVVDGGQLAIRPSGTEPKCKFYVAAHRRVGEGATGLEFEATKANVDETAVSLAGDVVRYALSLV